MDFFGYQDSARKKTIWLVGAFIVAVLLIILAVYLVCVVAVLFISAKSGTRIDPWQPGLLFWVMGTTILIVIGGSLWKIATLRRGGSAIAEMLGGRLVVSNTTDPDERRLLNVVEEVSIASGVPVPLVYLLDQESAINAFAAGFSANDAVIGVTRGGATRLTRDELQGVIAHEFSHILNGDMGLNLKLMGILHGILVIAMVGYAVMRGSSRIRGRNAPAAILFGLVVGLSLLLIGYVGVFFGRLIKSAVSRQREYLADASAVQFTRNPGGLSGALKKIGGLKGQARLDNRHAEEASHLFFGNALKPSWLSLLSTHPPLEDRVRRLDPEFDGSFPDLPEAAAGQTSDFSEVSPAVPLTPSEAVSRAGTLQPENLAYATGLVADLPPRLRDSLHDPFGAQASICALLISEQEAARNSQCQIIKGGWGEPFLNETLILSALIGQLGPVVRLPIVDMALPSLKQMSQEQYGRFRESISALIEADHEIHLFEFTLNRILLRHLDPHFTGEHRRDPKYKSLYSLQEECATLLSALARVGDSDETKAGRAFAAGLPFLGGAAARFKPLEQCDLGSVDAALERLAGLSPPLKKGLLEACAACVARDGNATLEELELFRAVADSMDCPMPPFAST